MIAKAAIPLVMLPLIATVTIVLVQFMILPLATVILWLQGVNPAPLWTALPLVRMDGLLVYFVSTAVLWYRRSSPGCCWSLPGQTGRCFFGPCCRRWLAVIEWIALRTTTVLELLQHRLIGSIAAAFDLPPTGDSIRSPQLNPVKYVATPGLWIGLAIAAAFLAASIWLRRRRDPI